MAKKKKKKVAKVNKKPKIGLLIRGKLDYALIVVTLLLLSIGLTILLSASAPVSISEEGYAYKYILKQGKLAGLGLVLMFIISRIDYRIFRKFKWIIYVVCIAILFIVGVSGTEEGGGRRWIVFLGFSFQPSEFAKVGFIIFYASLLSDLKESGRIKKAVPGCLYPAVFLIFVFLTVYKLQNHLSATLIICGITVLQMFVAGSAIVSDIKWLIPLGTAAVTGISYIINSALSATNDSSGFRSTRIKTWLRLSEADPIGEAWQINQSLFAIGSGGVFGAGLGKSKQKYLYLPEPQNDFIFAVLAEECGFIGCSIVILLFAFFIWRGIVIAMRAEDNFGTLIAIGVTAMIGLQALINIAVVTNTIPVTGMPLPFFSYGGSAMLANLMAVGFLLSVSRNRKKSN